MTTGKILPSEDPATARPSWLSRRARSFSVDGLPSHPLAIALTADAAGALAFGGGLVEAASADDSWLAAPDPIGSSRAPPRGPSEAAAKAAGTADATVSCPPVSLCPSSIWRPESFGPLCRRGSSFEVESTSAVAFSNSSPGEEGSAGAVDSPFIAVASQLAASNLHACRATSKGRSPYLFFARSALGHMRARH